jgi:predicted N-formylglutamate amidohydrolase
LIVVPELLSGANDILLLCDHASNAVPPDIDLGIDPALLNKHIAIDIGAEPMTRALAELLAAPAIIATVSRLVIDLNREAESDGLIPAISDGHTIPGNMNAARTERIARFYRPYHAVIERQVSAQRPVLIVGIHSFTPALESNGEPRPWEIGILYNRDVRAAAIAIDLLNDAGIATGDNEPYSGRVLNATLNRHAEASDIPSFTVELRNDLIDTLQGVARWAQILTPILATTRNRLALEASSET